MKEILKFLPWRVIVKGSWCVAGEPVIAVKKKLYGAAFSNFSAILPFGNTTGI